MKHIGIRFPEKNGGKGTSAFGTFETYPPILRMSVHRGKPEVA
jgi:hypothetical protein